MLLIYSPDITNRLDYTINLIFEGVIKTEYKLTTDRKIFEDYKGQKINYSNSVIEVT